MRTALVVLLLLCFGAQVWEGFLKFVKRQTTVVSTTELTEEGILPALSICPGFKDANHDYYENLYELHDVMNSEQGTHT